MIPDGQLLCCASDLLAGQIDARPMHFWARGILWMDAGIRPVQRNGNEAIVQEPSVVLCLISLLLMNTSITFSHNSWLLVTGLTGECRLHFFPCRPAGSSANYCKELLTLTLTPFFLMLFHVTCPFFLTPVAKYSHGFEKYSLVLR